MAYELEIKGGQHRILPANVLWMESLCLPELQRIRIYVQIEYEHVESSLELIRLSELHLGIENSPASGELRLQLDVLSTKQGYRQS